VLLFKFWMQHFTQLHTGSGVALIHLKPTIASKVKIFKPQATEVARSSGFARLNDAALPTVIRWRFVPGKRGGVTEAVWFNVPINWVHE
jgi:hypothetical protein